MIEEYQALVEWFARHPVLYSAASLSVLLLLAFAANWITKRILLNGLNRLLSSKNLALSAGGSLMPVVARLSNIIPALVIYLGIRWVPHLPEPVITVVDNVCSAFIVLTVALAVGGILNLAAAVYQRRPDAARRPIKGYVQVIKIGIYAVAAIMVIATLIDRSPLILLSGLGAMAAVLMLIFQDTLLSLVASVQITSNDMVRVGDWIEMPQLNADGDVIDVALHTVKVQNWDKTITTIPVKRLITDSFRNWRGMSESGGRRIMRNLYIDQQSVRFLTDEERAQMHRFALIDEYLSSKEQDILAWNEKQKEAGRADVVNLRRVTNIGTFRAYVERYLKNHPGIHQGMTLLVRQLSPTADGLPLQLYCFTNTTVWAQYEGIQSDIFDHLLAILPEFHLRTFQHPSGADMRSIGELNRLAAPGEAERGRGQE